MPDLDRRSYTVQITDVATGKNFLAAVDLTDDQRRALLAYIVKLTGARFDAGDVDLGAP